MELLYTSVISTPVGELRVAATANCIYMLEYPDEKRIKKHLEGFAKRFKIVEGTTPLVEQLSSELSDYFQGNRTEFTLPIQLTGTEFQQTVWYHLLAITYGSTRSYSEQSQRMEQPLAIRAIARANGQNKIAILVPCHRIIGANGSLTGYSGGTKVKKYLLDLEQGIQQGFLFR